ncbi:MAG TPA: peptide-methionine (S)-S-oxide reductase MsrA [Terriglobales bacterium]|nr:peptide-methionine (S)-S-oxide reductase MsrA [Terriglobales bacterium]
MSRSSLLLGIVLALAAVGITSSAAGASNSFPAAASDAALEPNHGSETAVLSGGCFWGVQAVFQHVKGVLKATSGYAGGTANNPNYEQVSTGSTGHAESVEITFDPSQVTYGQLLRVFFSVAHDPTELNRQGPDEGTQYRSAILYTSDEQKRIAEAYIAQLTAAKVFPRPIVTQVAPLKAFYPAEAYHQDYATLHPHDPYIMFNDAPKVAHLRQQFPEMYVGK